MNEFLTVLRDRIDAAQHGLEQAEKAGHEHEVHLHSARLLDLVDRATSHGVDTTEWVPSVVLATATRSVR
ncbi:hypothetical protein REH65_12505 [Saccharopolyspora sp. ID03-671]|uniref:hypothetical protein n=1 Tax=Saccharopolyspora sp. ID03-671 TaxID=3073066 RepID=UPI003245EB66